MGTEDDRVCLLLKRRYNFYVMSVGDSIVIYLDRVVSVSDIVNLEHRLGRPQMPQRVGRFLSM